MKVKVYRNLKHGRSAPPLYSIMYKGKVIARAAVVLLTNATFVVNEAGRRRVLREECKNVHAFVVGDLKIFTDGYFVDGIATPETLPFSLVYNPYAGREFRTQDGRAWSSASQVLLNERGMSAEGLWK